MRLRAVPIGPSAVPSFILGRLRRTARWLATARVSLAVAALFAVWMYPMQISWWAHWLLGIYVIHSTVVMLLFWFRKQSTPAFRALVHAADVIWLGLIYVFATGERNLFFLFFVFVLAAAAYGRGLRKTLATAAVSLTLLWSESVALRHGLLATLDGFVVRRHWPKLGIGVGYLEPKRLFILILGLLVMRWLLCYEAEQHERLRAAVERASRAELHDRVWQLLLRQTKRLDVPLASREGHTAEELRKIQNHSIEETRKLLELMQRMKQRDAKKSASSPRRDRWFGLLGKLW